MNGVRRLHVLRCARRPHPRGQLPPGVRIAAREAQISLEGVIADVEMPARASLVPAGALEHEPRIAASPRAHRLAGGDRGAEHFDVVAAELRREVVELN